MKSKFIAKQTLNRFRFEASVLPHQLQPSLCRAKKICQPCVVIIAYDLYSAIESSIMKHTEMELLSSHHSKSLEECNVLAKISDENHNCLLRCVRCQKISGIIIDNLM